jgi:hypothetical protein
MTIRLAPKRPDETRRLAHDWSPYLGADTIVSQSVTSSDVTISGVNRVGNVVQFTATGGTDSGNATILMSVTTSSGEIEKETFVLPIAVDEVLSLAEVKEYLGVFTTDRDRSMMQMIPRARLWVEDHTGIALVRRQFTERLVPSQGGVVRLSKSPLVDVPSVEYLDSSGSTVTFTPTFYPPIGNLFGTWPALQRNEAFEITYTAGELVQNVDDRLKGAMLALIEGEFSEGYAYPDRSIQGAKQCCAYLQTMVA